MINTGGLYVDFHWATVTFKERINLFNKRCDCFFSKMKLQALDNFKVMNKLCSTENEHIESPALEAGIVL